MRNIEILNQRILVKTCPICGEEANSPHHIKPISAGGKDMSYNKVKLCKRCHNIVESIYDKYGIEYCPELVYAIQREFDLSPIGKDNIKSKYISKIHNSGNRIPIRPKLIKKLYWDNGMSISLVANELGTSAKTIYKKMLRNGILIRNKSEALKNAYRLGRGRGN